MLGDERSRSKKEGTLYHTAKESVNGSPSIPNWNARSWAYVAAGRGGERQDRVRDARERK